MALYDGAFSLPCELREADFLQFLPCLQAASAVAYDWHSATCDIVRQHLEGILHGDFNAHLASLISPMQLPDTYPAEIQHIVREKFGVDVLQGLSGQVICSWYSVLKTILYPISI